MASPSSFRGDGAYLLQASHQNQGTPYKIFVHIIEARGLISNDPNHLSDALCILELGPLTRERRSTSVQEATMNAVWDQVFLFDDIMLTKEEFSAEKISLSVLHKSDFRRNKLIGNYEFSLGNIYRQKDHQYYRQWVPLTQPEKPENEEGYLLVTVYVLGPNDPTPMRETQRGAGETTDGGDGEDAAQLLQAPSQGEKKMFHLNVLIYRASDVLTTQYGRKNADASEGEAPDTGVAPFVSARFNGNVLQTTVASSDSADRTWNRALELPFHLPLRSDSIELILWNRRTGLRDEIIGVKAFNFFQMGLAHKAWGPRWVNLYAADYTSPQTTLLGKIKHYWLSEKTFNKHEYVGRILMRMSVQPTEEALLMSRPCPPALDPVGADFTLQVLLYSASELPVLGGLISVEVVFGTHRIQSEWRFATKGQAGTFAFNETLSPISSHAPLDLSQIHHVFLNIYHRVGQKIVKIAFERIPVASLMPQEGVQGNHYFLNGDTRILRGQAGLQSWPSRWRTLQHVHPDSKRKQVTAGFLLASIGFGLKRNLPQSIPRPTSDNYARYTLRIYVHQGANLLPALENGCSNPLLAVRFAGRSLVLPCQQKNTLFPLWFEVKELSGVYIDLLRAPSVYLMVLHQTTLGYVTLGRAEIAAEHILQNQNLLCRYRVKYDQDVVQEDGEGGASSGAAVPGSSPFGANSLAVNAAGIPLGQGSKTQKNLSDFLLSSQATRQTEDIEPYVLASFQLFRDDDADRFPRDKSFPPATRDFVVKIEAIGLRELEGVLADPSLQPELEIAVPIIRFANAPPIATTTGGGAGSGTGKAQTATGGPTAKGKQLLADSDSSSSSSAPPGGPSDDPNLASLEERRPEIRWDKQTPACGRPTGMGVQVLNIAMFTRVTLPITDPYSIPLRIRVLDSTSSAPKTCFCSRFIPLAQLLDVPLDMPRPPTYRGFERWSAGSGGGKGDASSGGASGGGSMAAGGLIGAGASNVIYEDDEKEGNHTTMVGAGGAGSTATGSTAGQTRRGGGAGGKAPHVTDTEIPKEYEGIELHVEDDEADVAAIISDAAAAAAPVDDPADDDPFTLDLDPQRLNVGLGTASEEVKFTDEWRAGSVVVRVHPENKESEGKEKEEAESIEMRAEEIDLTPQRPRLRLLSLFRNQVGGLSSGPGVITEACILKAYARCRMLPTNAREADKMLTELERDNLLTVIKPLYDRGYMARVYVYTGINLAPLSSFLDSYQSSNPYLVASNGTGPSHRVSYKAKAKRDDLNPEFFQVFDLPTSMPDHYKLAIQVWNAGTFGDDLIGAVMIDLETRLLQQTEAAQQAALDGGDSGFVPTTEYHDLKNESARTSQGKLSMKLEMLTEEEARRTKPDDVAPQVSTEYELRMVLWATRDVRFPTAADAEGAIDDVNQRVKVTTNFQNKRGREVLKATDVAWNASGGQAEWNYRMVWRLSLPSKMPRIKLAMWHETVMSEDKLIGECLYNLTPFFADALRNKQGIAKTKEEWVPFRHPLYRESNLGAVQVEFSLLTETEADKNPVGEAQNEPNRDPVLRDPSRNAPPWALGTKAFAAMAKWKKILMFTALILIAMGVAVALIVPIVLAG